MACPVAGRGAAAMLVTSSKATRICGSRRVNSQIMRHLVLHCTYSTPKLIVHARQRKREFGGAALEKKSLLTSQIRLDCYIHHGSISRATRPCSVFPTVWRVEGLRAQAALHPQKVSPKLVEMVNGA